MKETFAQKLERLATRVVSGDTVFFIGSGYSIDSEKNDAKILLARLVARFEGVTGHLADSPDPIVAEPARKLRDTFPKTFWLQTGPDCSVFDDKHLKANLDALPQSYYLINDWMCSAFEQLIAALARLPHQAQVAAAINERENGLLGRYHAIDKLGNTRPLAPIDIVSYVKLAELAHDKPAAWAENTVAGKALFLDTMGFADDAVMAGEPMGPVLDKVIKTFGSRLRPRHSTLAWLALEGLLPVLITTNYDLLLEGAYQLAGMLPLNPLPSRWPDREPGALEEAQAIKLPLNRRVRYFTRIADASQFFSHGEAQQAAMITKIHGCVDSYRDARRLDPAAWRAVLPTMVFTFREIQNWREDSWSRDLLKTLLRTRSVVFAGYSGADPVIHDTFRSVYEEMATHRARQSSAGIFPGLQHAAAPTTETAGGDATAFFMDVAEKREFHGLELLRAASMAAGLPNPELTDHPNLITFDYSHRSEFPHLDEVLEWTFHLCYRRLQLQALESELRRVAYQLLGNPCREREAEAIFRSFRQLLRFERKSAEHCEKMPGPEMREHFRRTTAWTVRFHYALMREFALAENLLRYPGDTFQIDRISAYPWYCPISEHPQWAAWAAVIELAIRRRAAAWRGEPWRWARAIQEVEPVRHNCPIVLLAGKGDATRRALRIELATMRGMSRRDRLAPHLDLLPIVSWTLRSETVPWWVGSDTRRPWETPRPADIWNWAAFGSPAPARANPEDIHAFFGGENGHAGNRHVA